MENGLFTWIQKNNPNTSNFFISNKLNDDLLLCDFEKAENDILELFNYNIDKNLFFQNFHQVENLIIFDLSFHPS